MRRRPQCPAIAGGTCSTGNREWVLPANTMRLVGSFDSEYDRRLTKIESRSTAWSSCRPNREPAALGEGLVEMLFPSVISRPFGLAGGSFTLQSSKFHTTLCFTLRTEAHSCPHERSSMHPAHS